MDHAIAREQSLSHLLMTYLVTGVDFTQRLGAVEPTVRSTAFVDTSAGFLRTIGAPAQPITLARAKSCLTLGNSG